jgi:hypothetical protein
MKGRHHPDFRPEEGLRRHRCGSFWRQLHPRYFWRHQRHGHVDENLVTQRVPNPVQGCAMRCIGNGQDRDVAALGGRPVIGAGDRTPRHLPLERFGGGARTLGIARTDDDRMIGSGPPHGEPTAFATRAAQNRNRRFHDERMSRARNPLRQANVARSRVSHFMNKFRELGLIDYNGHIEVHSSLLNVVLHDQPQLRR